MSARLFRLLSCLPALCALCGLPMRPAAAQAVATLAACARVADPAQRLACYDHLAAESATPAVAAAPTAVSAPASAEATQPGPATPPAAPPTTTSEPVFSLADHWELDADHRRGVFNFRPHNPNYLMFTRTAHPNDAPYRPFRRLTDLGTDLAHNEIVYQLGFKMKLVEQAFDQPLDLWFGYTQDSFWQAGNHAASSPFRETNYQPELMAVVPLNWNILGANVRFFNLGLVHQSNGQSSTLSRSWNRVYGQLGVEAGRWTVVGRVWKRINEAHSDDDNPDIVDYMGRGDLAVTYRQNGNDVSALLRHNFSTGRGAVQLNWAWPLKGHIKGYAQAFSGYGQSLIDYNYYQNVLGLGVLGTF